MAKKRKNSQNIGATYERHCAKLFTEWWKRGVFGRTKGMQVLGHSERLAHGDITCVIGEPLILDQTFPFSIECKKSESWSFQEFLKGNPSLLVRSFWQQCKHDAFLWKKEPLLVFTCNHHPDYALVKSSYFRLYDRELLETYEPKFYFQTLLEGDEVIIMTLSNFFGAFLPIGKEV